MKKLKVGLYAAATYVALIIVFSITTPRRGDSQQPPPQSIPVHVTNTKDQPVPVAVQGPVEARVSNPIAIDPEANEVCASDCNAKNAVHIRGANILTHPLSYEVPEGKRLVIETVSGSATTGRSDTVHFQVRIGVALEDRLFEVNIPAERGVVLPGITHWVATQPMKIYAGGGTTVNGFVRSSGDLRSASMFIAGYLVDDH